MKFGLIGHPVGHSFSKIIHGMLGNDAYEIIDLLPEEVCPFLQRKDFVGINVTLPYKEAVMPYLDEVEPQAAAIGAVNTIIQRDGRLKGYNTDYYGFKALVLRYLKAEEIPERKVLILGTGGTSKTVEKVFVDFGVENVFKVSRNPKGHNVLSMKEAATLGADVVVNTTPVGMYPNEEHCIAEEYRDAIYASAKLCLDVVYRPLETEFVKEARRRNIPAEGGLYMLVGQAVYGAKLFLQKDIPDGKIEEVFMEMKEYLQDKLHISKTEILQGEVVVPPSKSYSHRHLIMAALAKGKSVLYGIGKSNDIDVTMSALAKMGASIQVLYEDEKERTLSVDGSGFLTTVGDGEIYCGESGSSLRFLLPIGLRTGKTLRFSGEAGLMRRPMEIYREICIGQKLMFEKKDNGIEICGSLKSGKFCFPGNISSQFVTGLLFVLPFLQGDSEIHLLPPVESLPYIEMTIQALREWGVYVEMKGTVLFIPGGQQATPREVHVEKDYSNGAYLWAYNIMGHSLKMDGLEGETLQGDKAFYDIFRRLKTEVHPVISMEQTPDLVPVAMAVAAYFSGAVFTGTKRLEIKESNRGVVMAEELEKFGIRVRVEENYIEVFDGQLLAPGKMLCGHNDHRIVMALSMLLSVTGGRIDGYHAVEKSFPTYFEDLEACGLKLSRDSYRRSGG